MLRRLARSLGTLAVSLLIACSPPPAGPSPAEVEARATAQIQTIPPADPDKYGRMRDVRDWKNPYLILHGDSVGILDVNNNVERTVKPDELLDALSKLPASAWPYGRVVAIQEPAPPKSESEAVEMRRQRGIVAGTLVDAKVLVNWIPATSQRRN